MHEQAESDKALRSAVIEALTRVYDSVWLIDDVDTQRFQLYRVDESLSHLLPANQAATLERFTDAFAFYSNLVLEEDRQGFLDAVTPEEIMRNTENRIIYSVPFLRVFNTGIRYYRLEFAKLDLQDRKGAIVAGSKDVDEEVRREQAIQQALRDAVDAANASSKAKSDFLSNMSHDIRTPMNGIIGMTAIATNNLDDREKVADCLHKITESSNHLLSLINEFLHMSKIESGKIELMEEEFNLAELIDGMLAMTRPQIQAHNHTFRMDIVDVQHSQRHGDEQRVGALWQVCRRPRENALRAGEGVFRHHHRLEDSRPRRCGDHAANPTASGKRRSHRHLLRLRLVTDQEINAEIARDFLEMTGLEVDWAKDGAEAVKMIEAAPDGYYAMILSDIRMPVMDGYEETKAIQAMDRPYAQNIPIVAMSANAFAEDVMSSKKVGMNDHIAKPIDIEVLAQVLSKYVR